MLLEIDASFTFFNGHYDSWCYLPLVATLAFNTEPTQAAAECSGAMAESIILLELRWSGLRPPIVGRSR